MTKEVFFELIKNNSDFLTLDDYKFVQIGDCIIQFQKSLEETGYMLNFQYHEGADKTGYFYRINAVFACKRFNQVEKEIQKILDGNLTDYYTIHVKPEVNIIPNKLEHDDFIQNVSYYIRKEEDMLLFLEFVKSFYYQTAIPFFEKFSDIHTVSRWLENNYIQNHKNLLTVNGNTMMLRKLLIMKMTKSKEYESLYHKYKEFLEKKDEVKESPYPKMYDVFKKLIPVFEGE